MNNTVARPPLVMQQAAVSLNSQYSQFTRTNGNVMRLFDQLGRIYGNDIHRSGHFYLALTVGSQYFIFISDITVLITGFTQQVRPFQLTAAGSSQGLSRYRIIVTIQLICHLIGLAAFQYHRTSRCCRHSVGTQITISVVLCNQPVSLKFRSHIQMHLCPHPGFCPDRLSARHIQNILGSDDIIVTRITL